MVAVLVRSKLAVKIGQLSILGKLINKSSNKSGLYKTDAPFELFISAESGSFNSQIYIIQQSTQEKNKF